MSKPPRRLQFRLSRHGLMHRAQAVTFLSMCRNIKLLHHFAPPATDEEIRASALQYVRKLSGLREPGAHNQVAFDRAVQQVTLATKKLFDALEVHGPPRSREVEKLKAMARGQKRDEALRKRFGAAR